MTITEMLRVEHTLEQELGRRAFSALRQENDPCDGPILRRLTLQDRGFAAAIARLRIAITNGAT